MMLTYIVVDVYDFDIYALRIYWSLMHMLGGFKDVKLRVVDVSFAVEQLSNNNPGLSVD